MAQPGPTDETTLAPAADGETGVPSGSAPTTTGTPVASSGSGKRAPSSSHSGWLSSSSGHDGRIPAGTILADRYRIIGLAGHGGMGEVYRADDLRLGQLVALKFLPESVAKDATRLAQFHNEVRIARQISHRNVCRVYDIGEAEDRIFLTMEHVDGEDLSTLLRRIGRFPSDKAIEIARQLCAGLAAAHELNVLHRDLKPANVMLDGEGRVRITDFGLAGIAGEIKDIRAGTPAYMAPEQLAGREVSIRSDLFALGLVLYEIFTGKRAFDAKNVAELLRMHDEGIAVTPTAAVRDMDPAVERVIMRCLERDPHRRPPSALAVAAALPGGDPLAAALAAGETPSPEMVANAGNREAIHPALALGTLAAMVVLFAGFLAFINAIEVMHRIPFDKPPEVLLDRARSVSATLGYPMQADSHYGFDVDGDYFRYVMQNRQTADRWREVMSGRNPLVMFWYRTSPRTLAPTDIRRSVEIDDPPLVQTGMTQLSVDTLGRLIAFDALPSQGAAATGPPPVPNWDLLFSAAELPKDRFVPAAPTWLPRGFADTRAAWSGTLPELGDTPIRVEAAAYQGRITSFALVFPWAKPRVASPDTRNWTDTISRYLYVFIVLAVNIASAIIARRNVRLGRGNREGAFRLAVFTFSVSLTAWFLRAAHVPWIENEQQRMYDAIGFALFESGMFWVLYLALEPIVRRFWPDGLISWNRLLAGRWRDPLVGWHVLCGAACGIALALTIRGGAYLIEMLEHGSITFWFNPVFYLASSRYLLGSIIDHINDGVNTALFVVLCYAIARGSRAAMGRHAMALVVMTLILMAALAREFLSGRNLPLEIGFMLLVIIVIIIAMLRFGVLAMAVMFFVNNILHTAPFTLNSSDWFSPLAYACTALVLGIAVFGFWLARGGEPLFGRLAAE